MGSLSPRTRNAQVALYQSGEVDFLVATDAIGMGLNMDVDQFDHLFDQIGVQILGLGGDAEGAVAQVAARAACDLADLMGVQPRRSGATASWTSTPCPTCCVR